MRLSYSSISMYQNCPLSYKFRYVDRLPTKRTPQLSFGSSLHAVLASFYQNALEKLGSLDTLLECLPQFWESDGYSDLSEEQRYLEQAKEVLTQFYHSNADLPQIPFALEHKFAIELDCCTLSGIIDRVDKLPTKGLEIIDYKTSQKLPPKSRIHSDLQLSIYHLACRELWGAEPEKLSLYFLIPNTKMSTKRGHHDIERTKTLIAKVCNDIEAQRFEPRQNSLCPWCDFQTSCPVQETDSISETGMMPAQEPSMDNVISEWFAARRKLESYQARLNQLEQVIHSYCERHKTDRLESAVGVILRNRRLIQSYNVAKLKDILGPSGLWEQICTVDAQQLRSLMNQEDLDHSMRERLRSAIEEEQEDYTLLARASDRESPKPQNLTTNK